MGWKEPSPPVPRDRNGDFFFFFLLCSWGLALQQTNPIDSYDKAPSNKLFVSKSLLPQPPPTPRLLNLGIKSGNVSDSG